MFQVRKWGQYVFLYSIVAVLLAGVVLPAAKVGAQATAPLRPPLSLMTSPLPLNIITSPGKTVTADLRVKNNSTRTENLKIELLKFGASGESGNPQLQEREEKDVHFDWVSFSEPAFVAEPNVWKTIKMTIKTPDTAAFGYYYAVLFSRANPDRPTGGASGVEGGVASLVLLNVDAPGAKREAKVAQILSAKKVYEFLPAEFTVKLRNSGNVHVAPVGSIFIKRGSKQVAVIDFNDQRGNILPGTNRVFENTWNDGFPRFEEKMVGNKATRELKWDFGDIQKLRFGKYTATLVAVYDDGQRDVPVEAVVSFWVIPWRALGVLLLVLLLVGIGIWATLRSFWRKIRRKPPTDTPSGDAPPISPPATTPVAPATPPKPAAKPTIERKTLNTSASVTAASTAPPLPGKSEQSGTKSAPEVTKETKK